MTITKGSFHRLAVLQVFAILSRHWAKKTILVRRAGGKRLRTRKS
jgi:hypothetical protein